jgi:hypothetical protein
MSPLNTEAAHQLETTMVEMTATAYRDERGSCALSYEPNFLARDPRPNDTSFYSR